jgi:branched-chain amino acid transport system ATP-binding protein
MDDVLKVDNLTKTFGGLTAVDDVSFTIKKNEVFGLIGPNGAGKTTAFNLITGVYKVTSGDIEFLGKKIQDKPPFEIAQAGITRTFQNIRLFKKLSVYDNIFTACHLGANYTLPEAILFGTLPKALTKKSRYAREESELRDYTVELLNIMGLHDRKDILANNLPYGLQRRLEIARALAVKPQLLLLDEPAAGMNPEETNQLMMLIDDIRHKFNLTVLLIEHHMELVMGVCDNIAVLNFGAKIAEGTASEIQNNSKVKEAYLGEEEEEEPTDA